MVGGGVVLAHRTSNVVEALLLHGSASGCVCVVVSVTVNGPALGIVPPIEPLMRSPLAFFRGRRFALALGSAVAVASLFRYRPDVDRPRLIRAEGGLRRRSRSTLALRGHVLGFASSTCMSPGERTFRAAGRYDEEPTPLRR